MIQGNIVFWQAVGVICTAAAVWLAKEGVAWLRNHGELTKAQTWYQRQVNAYAGWKRELAPLIAEAVPLVEKVLQPIGAALVEETGLPLATLMSIGQQVAHDVGAAAAKDLTPPPSPQPPTPPPATPVAAGTTSAPATPAPAAAPTPPASPPAPETNVATNVSAPSPASRLQLEAGPPPTSAN